MPKLIFDIETVGVEFDSLDETSKHMLLEYAEDDEERENIKNELVFSPLTGRVVAIAILNPDTDKGAVYFQSQDDKLERSEEDNLQLVPCKDEKEILKQFWDLATHYDYFVTFNGRCFDCPFLAIRSAILKIKPSINLNHNRYAPGPHIDLFDRLTNYGAVRWRKGLHMWCQGFGITSPKDQGVTGNEVAQLFK